MLAAKALCHHLKVKFAHAPEQLLAGDAVEAHGDGGVFERERLERRIECRLLRGRGDLECTPEDGSGGAQRR